MWGSGKAPCRDSVLGRLTPTITGPSTGPRHRHVRGLHPPPESEGSARDHSPDHAASRSAGFRGDVLRAAAKPKRCTSPCLDRRCRGATGRPIGGRRRRPRPGYRTLRAGRDGLTASASHEERRHRGDGRPWEMRRFRWVSRKNCDAVNCTRCAARSRGTQSSSTYVHFSVSRRS
jgi:hypothetical protein